MARRSVLAAALSLPVAVLSVLTVGTPSAVAKPSPAKVQLSAKPIQIAYDGSVRVALSIRCAPGLNAFEYGAGARQGTVSGGTTVGPAPNVVPCDRKRHKVTVRVVPETGEFAPGKATLDANLSLFDPADDSDLFFTDTQTVKLR